MRPSIVIACLGVLGVVFLGIFCFKREVPPVLPSVPVSSAEAPPVPVSVLPKPVPVTVIPPVATPIVDPMPEAVAVAPAPDAPVAAVSEEQHQAAIDAETGRLQQLTLGANPADLPSVLADLKSSEPEIREAAIQAVKQMGNPDAVPALKAAAAATDARERVELLDAADFIALPDLPPPVASAPKTPEQIQANQQKQAQTQADKLGKFMAENHIPYNTVPTMPAADPGSAPPPNP